MPTHFFRRVLAFSAFALGASLMVAQAVHISPTENVPVTVRKQPKPVAIFYQPPNRLYQPKLTVIRIVR